MLDRARVLAKLDEVEVNLRELEQRTPKSLAAYTADLGVRLAVERLLHISIEGLLDAGHLFSHGLRLGLPDNEPALLRRLGEAGILTADEVALLRELQRFRNVLVHRYGQLDAARVHAHALRAPAALRGLVASFRRAADTMTGK